MFLRSAALDRPVTDTCTPTFDRFHEVIACYPAKKAPFRNYLIDGTSTGTIILLETIKRKRRRNADPWAPLATVTTVFE